MFRRLFMIITLLYPTIANAEPQGMFSTLSKNEPAPFEGVLFDPVATALILSGAEMFKLNCDLDIEFMLDKQSTEFHLERQELNLRITSITSEYDLMTTQKDIEIAQLQKAIKSQSPRNKWLWAAAGVAVGGLSTYAIMNAK